MIDARKKAETEATAVTVAAEAEKQAALDQADAIRTLASVEAAAAQIKAAGVREIGKANAENEQLLNEARSRLSAAIIEYELSRERLRIRIAGQLLAYQANKPILDRILQEAGFSGDGPVKALLGATQPNASSVKTPGSGSHSSTKTDGPVSKPEK